MNGTIEQISPLGWQEVERAKEQGGELAITFDYRGLKGVRLTLRGGDGLDLLLKLDGVVDRLKRMGVSFVSLEDYQQRHDAVYPPSGQAQIPTQDDTHLTVSFELRGYPCSIEFREDFDKLLSKLPGMMQRLTREGAIPPPKKFVGSEGTDLPQSGSRVPISVLSRQERRTLVLVANGMSYSEIARDLGISQKTAATYASRLKLKLGLYKHIEMLWYAAENGLFKDGRAYEPTKRGRPPKEK